MPRPLIPDRRDRILDTAEALVLERGFDAMSIQSIAGAVGIAKGAVYREFESKHAVLDALLQRSMTRMTAAADALLESGHPPSLSRAYAVGAEVLLDDPLMRAAFLDDRGVLGSYVDSVTDGRYRRRYEAVAAWVRTLQSSGRLDPSLDPDGLALALSSTTLGLLSAARHLGPITSDDLRTAIATVAALVAGHEAARA